MPNDFSKINWHQGIWGHDTCVIDNKVWKPYCPMVSRIKPGSLVAKFYLSSDDIQPEETIHEILCCNRNNVHEDRWISVPDFKEGMKVQVNIEMKLRELEHAVDMMKGLVRP